MNKRGLGNIEFILAFMLFIAFVSAAVYFFNPTKNTGITESSVSYIFDRIIENTSIDIDAYSVKINDVNKQCAAVTIENIGVAKNARVEDYYGNFLDSRRSESKIYFDISQDNEAGKNDFAIIYFSEDFIAGDFECSDPEPSDYTNAFHSTNKLISENKMLKLNKSYFDDYESLKSSMGIPPGLDFSFSLNFQDKTSINAERSAPLRTNVFSETKIKEVLRTIGESEFAYLTVKAW